MIPNTSNLVAVFQREGQGEYMRQIIAWSNDGDAMIAPSDGSKGQLRPARLEPDFAYVWEAESGALNGYMAVLPGGGWVYRWKDTQNGGTVDEPVIGWAVTVNGDAHPIVSDGQGGASTCIDIEAGDCLLHPRVISGDITKESK